MEDLAVTVTWVIGSMILAGIVGSAAWGGLVWVLRKRKARIQLRNWESANLTWDKYKSLFTGLDLVQGGWQGGKFMEHNVLITLEEKFSLDPDIDTKILQPMRVIWEDTNITNNVQVGVVSIDSFRMSEQLRGDDVLGNHLLHIKAKTYKYYEMLATNWSFSHSSSDEARSLLRLKNHDPELHALQPVEAFANPLSVGITVICEGGKSLVLARRSSTLSTGGMFWANTIYNPVGECINLKDESGHYRGFVKLSPWKAAERALVEELGWNQVGLEKIDVALHSFVWDRRLLDYKFFGCVVVHDSWADIRRRWEAAPDRHESRDLFKVDVSTKEACERLVGSIYQERQRWSSEASLSTVRSLLFLDKITSQDVENIIARAGG